MATTERRKSMAVLAAVSDALEAPVTVTLPARLWEVIAESVEGISDPTPADLLVISDALQDQADIF